MANKVKFGLKNVHYAIVTETPDALTGEITSTYGTPKKWPGAVSLSTDPAGTDDENFDADDGVYYVIQGANQGYTGTFESALVPDDVVTAVLGARTDDDGVIVESSDDVRKYVALMFEIDGDIEARRFVYYKVLFSRNALSASTKVSNGTNTPQTDTNNFTAVPRPDDNLTRSFTSAGTTAAVYSAWYNSVFEPTFTP